MRSGFLLINKLAQPDDESSRGYTSHDVVDALRKITGIKKIGHAGTLDPFASGLLIVAVGRESTKRLGEFLKLDKEYIATLKLGATSDTYDRTGNISEAIDKRLVTKEKIEHALEKYRGELMQEPPMFSAKKIAGKKLYELARQGKEIERAPVQVIVHKLEILDYDPTQDLLELKCEVSSGTYIRSLANGIGNELEVGAYLQELKRTKIGRFSLDDAVLLSDLTQENWQNRVIEL